MATFMVEVSEEQAQRLRDEASAVGAESVEAYLGRNLVPHALDDDRRLQSLHKRLAEARELPEIDGEDRHFERRRHLLDERLDQPEPSLRSPTV